MYFNFAGFNATIVSFLLSSLELVLPDGLPLTDSLVVNKHVINFSAHDLASS